MPDSHDSPASGLEWSVRHLLVLAGCTVFLGTMVAIPLYQLRIPLQSRQIGRFGWQMYARDHSQPTFVAIDAAGRTSEVRSRYRMRTWWGDFGYRQALVRDMCGQAAGAVRIVAHKDYLPGYVEEFRCP